MNMRIAAFAALILAAGVGAAIWSVNAQDAGVSSHVVTPEESGEGYWTEERMRNAKPMDMGVAVGEPSPDMACPEDAKICPDGTAVARQAPDCQFAACPGEPGYMDPTQPPPVACSMEAKICPDGSSVSREGPNCAFALCPDESARSEPSYGGGSSPPYSGDAPGSSPPSYGSAPGGRPDGRE